MMESSSPSRPISEPSAVTRRAFLARAATGLVAAALPTGPWGCTLPVRSYAAGRARHVTIPLASFPELARVGGTIKILSQHSRALFVRHEVGDTWLALSAVCTHQGCLVAPSGAGFKCPCHGSRYDAAGANVSGPAKRPLVRFPIERRGDALYLRILDEDERKES